MEIHSRIEDILKKIKHIDSGEKKLGSRPLMVLKLGELEKFLEDNKGNIHSADYLNVSIHVLKGYYYLCKSNIKDVKKYCSENYANSMKKLEELRGYANRMDDILKKNRLY